MSGLCSFSTSTFVAPWHLFQGWFCVLAWPPYVSRPRILTDPVLVLCYANIKHCFLRLPCSSSQTLLIQCRIGDPYNQSIREVMQHSFCSRFCGFDSNRNLVDGCYDTHDPQRIAMA